MRREISALAAGSAVFAVLLITAASGSDKGRTSSTMTAGSGSGSRETSSSGFLPTPEPQPSGMKPIGPTCHSEDPSKVCLGLKYVVYRNRSGSPVISVEQAVTNVNQINEVWKQCGIAFQIDQFLPVNPADVKMRFGIGEYAELDDVRRTFGDDSTLLVATTGAWNRSGGLGNTGANAWTAMPGSGPYGVVLEAPVGSFANIIGHELGHYLDLDHVDDKSDLMNPIIYGYSTTITPGQCKTAFTTAVQTWGKMNR